MSYECVGIFPASRETTVHRVSRVCKVRVDLKVTRVLVENPVRRVHKDKLGQQDRKVKLDRPARRERLGQQDHKALLAPTG
jgi:hypothetical protein